MKNNVAFIGLGAMGYPMAGHLSNTDYPTKVYNRTLKKSHAWAQEYGGESCLTPSSAAQNSEFVFFCVGNDDDVRSVVFSQGSVSQV